MTDQNSGNGMNYTVQPVGAHKIVTVVLRRFLRFCSHDCHPIKDRRMDLLPVEGDSNVQISRQMQVTRPKQHLSAQQATVDHLEMMIASPQSLATG